MNKMKWSILFLFSMAVLGMTACNNTEHVAEQTAKSDSSSVGLSTSVTMDMCQPSYWIQKQGDSNKVLMSFEEIAALNQELLKSKDTAMYDLLSMEEEYDADLVKSKVSSAEIPDKELYKNGKLLDSKAYFKERIDAIKQTGYSKKQSVKYGICVNRTDVKQWPETEMIGYSEEDTDDELINTSLNVNEPFLIQAKCELDGKTYYWGYHTSYAGWVDSENIAICQSREEWIDAWQIDVQKKDFLVVTQDKIELEPSTALPEISEKSLMLGTTLKLVSKTDMPEVIGERGTWNNYVVSLPTRDSDGRYKKAYAEIPQHYSVNIGFLPMTQENIADLAFTCLGNRYGWGGMLGAMDCSLYTRSLYRCFGLELPRDTVNQTAIPEKTTDLSEMSDQEKSDFLKKQPIGSILFFPGHVMMYLGSSDSLDYVISATGFVSDPEEESTHGQYSIVINPLTAKRRDGSTWLSNLSKVVSFQK